MLIIIKAISAEKSILSTVTFLRIIILYYRSLPIRTGHRTVASILVVNLKIAISYYIIIILLLIIINNNYYYFFGFF